MADKASQPGAKAIALPRWLQARIEAEAQKFLCDESGVRLQFREPEGEPALTDPESISWQVFKNPLTLFIGGVTAVILELAEPRVRSGVWDHTSFRTDPVRRLKRTGLAAMMTVYGPRSEAEAMIAGIRRLHERVKGVTPGGRPYSASDPELLDWVHATAAFGFLEAYRNYVRPLGAGEASRFYAESEAAAKLYGAIGVPKSEGELLALFARMAPNLEPSPIIFEFLDIMRHAPVLPRGIRALQGVLVRSAVGILPGWVRDRLTLGAERGLRSWERPLVRAAARLADRIPLADTPPVEACLRLGLPRDFLYGKPSDEQLASEAP